MKIILDIPLLVYGYLDNEQLRYAGFSFLLEVETHVICHFHPL